MILPMVKLALAFFLTVLLVSPTFAVGQDSVNKTDLSSVAGFGGPTSVSEQMREDAEVREPAFRFPAIDSFLSPWIDWKGSISERYGLNLGIDYSALYQGASDTLPQGEDKAASGALRLFGRWALLNRGGNNPGFLVFKVENRHRIGTDIPPSKLGFEVGYNGLTGTLFSDVGTVLVDLNWQQAFNDSRGGVIIGRYDPNDYMDVSGHANPWTTFSNLSVLINTSIALPDSSFGLGAGHWIQDQWFVIGAVNDANGVIDDLGIFEDGAEFFSFVELGWTPERAQRYTNQFHLTYWHVDERVNAGLPESEGVAIGSNWTFDEKWMPFFRAGWSKGDAPLANRTATVGLIRRVHKRDLFGLGLNWSDPAVNTLRDQYSSELFYRFQFSQNLAVTPSLQWLVDPALNPTQDEIWVFGLRARLTM